MLQGKGLLSPIQQSFISFFAALPDQEQFYLTGGTALSEFYLGHRLSFDLDIFTKEDGLILPMSYRIESASPYNDLNFSVIRRFSGFVQFVIKQEDESLKVDMALDSPFSLAQPILSEKGVWVNNYQDLKADKLLAFFGRAEPRDAVDLYFLMGLESLESLIELASQKDPGFDLYWFAIALERVSSFPDPLERWPVRMIQEFDPITLKKKFHQLAMEIMSKIDPKKL